MKKAVPGRRRKNSKPVPAPAIRKVHYVVSSHWDREWYQTFQDYRRRLVTLLDRVIEDLEAGKLKGPFTTDGQAIMLDDYLEIRPERRAQVKRLAEGGKLKIGPWYVMPDEWLVSGESLIRNLRLGRETARSHGGAPSDAGFVCDLFGHIGQLPQILKGFGITGGLLWRGLEPRATAHIIWEGADGTELPCYRFGRAGYCDYAWDVRKCTEPELAFDAAAARADLKAFLSKEAGRTAIPPLLIFDGGDHLEYDEDHYRLLFGTETGADFPYEIVHGTLDGYLAEVVRHEDEIAERVKGELREVGVPPAKEDYQWLIPGVLSSRVWIKQSNAECQTLLCQWAEPVAAMASQWAGAAHPTAYLDTAWRWLLQNHPHDSICGCSIDEVHEDMKYRFAQCRQIASAQTDESLRMLARSIEGEIGEKELRVVVANPLTAPLTEPVELTLNLPAEWGCFGEFFNFEIKPSFRIFDAKGKELPYQLIAQKMGRSKTALRRTKFPEIYRTNDSTVSVELALPALGYTTLTVREGEKFEKDGPIGVQYAPVRHASTPGLATSECSMENESLRVVIRENGTLTVTDKRTKQVYERLLTFEDVADIGDGWYHGPPVSDLKMVSTGGASEIALVCDGPRVCQFRIRTTMQVPEEFDFTAMRRREERKALVIDSLVSLRAGASRIEVQTTVENTCKDHRLRVLLPSGAKAETYLADSSFDVVERPVALPQDNFLKRELAVETTPQQTWTAVAKGNRGLAVVSKGLMESAVRDLPERPIALTLFRSTRRTVLTDGQPEGQLLGRMTFDYWIVPVMGTVDRFALCQAGMQLAAGIKTVQLRRKDLEAGSMGRELPMEASFLSVKGKVVVTSVRRVDDALEVRLFNPEERRVEAGLDFSRSAGGFQTAAKVDLESRVLEKLRVAGGKVSLALRGKEIATVRVG